MRPSEGLEGVRSAIAECSAKASKRSLSVYGRAVPCRAGCHGCCKRLVYVSLAEAIVMLVHLKKEGSWPEARARAMSSLAAAKTSPEAYFRMGVECPVLDPAAKTCLAYPVRPSPCSTHFVLSHPDLCDPWSAKGGDYRPVGMEDLHAEFQAALAAAVDGRGVLALRMPMAMALLLAERVEDGGQATPERLAELVRAEFA